MLKSGDPVHIEYIRPGKEITYYKEDFVFQDEICLRTHKTLPPEIAEHLSQVLQNQNMIAPHQRVKTIAKTYFFSEPFNLLGFRNDEGALLGHYSDIGEPVLQLEPGKFQMTDLYLDIWLYPDGRLLELDWEEFEEAITRRVITLAQADLARGAMQRLVGEVAQGTYPSAYLKSYTKGKIEPMFNLAPILEAAKDKLIAVSFYDLETNSKYALNADEQFHPASTFKVHVMMEVLHQVEAGLLSLEERIPLINSFTSIADGSRYSLLEKDDAETTLYARIGETESISELTRLMIVRSSNLATNILIEKIGTSKVNDFIQALGIEGVTVRRGVEDNVAFRLGMNNSATAAGLTQTMQLLAAGSVVSERASNLMIQIMLRQEFNESIPALLPKSVKVAHKTGWTGEYYHDTGIVFIEGRKPYALSILTCGFAEDKADEAHRCMAEISKTIYTLLQ